MSKCETVASFHKPAKQVGKIDASSLPVALYFLILFIFFIFGPLAVGHKHECDVTDLSNWYALIDSRILLIMLSF